MAETIQIPFALKMRRLRYKAVPAVTFLLALGVSAWLWSRQGGGGGGVGEVSVVTLHVTAPHDGRLADTGRFPRLYDTVTPGQVLAVLTPAPADGAAQPINLAAPAAGAVTAIRHRPGEFVKQGQELFTVTRADSPHIIAYVRPGQGKLPKKDTKVLVRSNRHSAQAVVQEVGTNVEPIPEHQLANPKTPEWGIPVRISIPDVAALPLMPGEIVRLTYLP